MKFLGLHILLLSGLVLMSMPSLADKGFFDCSSEPSLHSVWKSTFLLKAPHEGGTAFLVKIVKNVDSATLSFITNRHVFNKCGASICAVKLGRGVGFQLGINSTSGNVKMVGPVNVGEEPSFWLSDDNAHVVDDSNADLALVTITTKDLKLVSSLTPINLPKTCPDVKKDEKLYRIGYPALLMRNWVPALDDRLQAKIMKERCSQGQIYEDDESDFPFETTIDELPGNSGGPVVNKSGALVGVSTQWLGTDYEGGVAAETTCDRLIQFISPYFHD